MRTRRTQPGEPDAREGEPRERGRRRRWSEERGFGLGDELHPLPRRATRTATGSPPLVDLVPVPHAHEQAPADVLRHPKVRRGEHHARDEFNTKCVSNHSHVTYTKSAASLNPTWQTLATGCEARAPDAPATPEDDIEPRRPPESARRRRDVRRLTDVRFDSSDTRGIPPDSRPGTLEPKLTISPRRVGLGANRCPSHIGSAASQAARRSTTMVRAEETSETSIGNATMNRSQLRNGHRARRVFCVRCARNRAGGLGENIRLFLEYSDSLLTVTEYSRVRGWGRGVSRPLIACAARLLRRVDRPATPS